MLHKLTEKLRAPHNLTRQETEAALAELVGDETADTVKAEFLAALTQKGETVEEIAAFAMAVRDRAVNPHIDRARLGGILADVCGTGADGLHTFNISTTSMFIVAAAGVPIAKHGNRGITSKCGGADVLEALGVCIELTPQNLKRCVEEVGVGFLFAPLYHLAFKKIAPVRRLLAEKKIRTVFNLLGPLVNPARVNVQLIGVFDPAFTPKFAEVLRLMGHRRAMVVHGFTDNGGRGMDELSTLGPTQISELRADGSIDTFSIDATALGLARARLEDLVGDTPTENAQTLRAILIGKERGPKADMVLLNAAAALVACDKAADFEEGIALARQQIQTGAANAVLEKLIKFTQQVK